MKDEQIHKGFAEILASLNRPTDAYKLHSANRLYAQQDYQLLTEFLAVVKENYKSEVLSVDFKGNAEGVRVEINDSVAKMTNEKIRDLIGSGVLDAATRLVLVNAVYFKGNWRKKFDVRNTVKKTFHSSPNTEVQVRLYPGENMAPMSRFGFQKINTLRLFARSGRYDDERSGIPVYRD